MGYQRFYHASAQRHTGLPGFLKGIRLLQRLRQTGLIEHNYAIQILDNMLLRPPIRPNNLKAYGVVPLSEAKRLNELIRREVATRRLNQPVLNQVTRRKNQLRANGLRIRRPPLQFNPKPIVRGLCIISIKIGRPFHGRGNQIEITISVDIS